MNIKIKTAVAGILLNASALTTVGQQNRTVGDFTGIKAGDAFNIIISQSDANAVKVDAPNKINLSCSVCFATVYIQLRTKEKG